MRTLISVFAVLALAAGLIGLGAEEGKKQKPQKATGEITSVDDANITISITKKAKKKKDQEASEPEVIELTLTIDDDTEIKVNGEEASAADLKAGTQAEVSYRDDTAVKITVGKKQKEKKAKKQKEDTEEDDYDDSEEDW